MTVWRLESATFVQKVLRGTNFSYADLLKAQLPNVSLVACATARVTVPAFGSTALTRAVTVTAMPSGA